MPKIEIFVVSAECLLSARGSGDTPQVPTSGSAVVNMLDREWQISGTCEVAGDDLTFVGPGDPDAQHWYQHRQQKVARAQASGRLAKEIIPVSIPR